MRLTRLVPMLLAIACSRGAGLGDAAVPTVAVVEQRLEVRVPAEGNLAAVHATPIAVPVEAPGPLRLAWLAPDGAPVRAGEVVARFDPTDLERDLAAARGELEIAERRRAKGDLEAGAALDDLAGEAELATSDLAAAGRFQKKDDLVFSRREIAESALDRELAAARAGRSREASTIRRRQAAAEGELQAIAARKAGLAIERSQRGLAAVEVRAAHDGLLIVKKDFRGQRFRPGDTVFPGQPIAELPDLAAMRAEVYVLEADAAGLERGRPATVIVESRPDEPLPARVERVDSLAKPRFRGSPIQSFAVDLSLGRTLPAVMKPGARVRASIAVETRARALLIPRQALFERDGRGVVYRRMDRGQASGFAPVEVATSPAGAGRLIVESGLAPGDVVALVDPSRSQAARGSAAHPAEGGKDDAQRAPARGPAAPRPARGGRP